MAPVTTVFYKRYERDNISSPVDHTQTENFERAF